MIYIFEIPIFAIVLLIALLLGIEISELLMVFSGVVGFGMLILLGWAIVSFYKEIKEDGFEKFQYFLCIFLSAMFLIASIRLYMYGYNNPDLTAFQILFGEI